MRATQMDMIIGTAGYNDGVYLTSPNGMPERTCRLNIAPYVISSHRSRFLVLTATI